MQLTDYKALDRIEAILYGTRNEQPYEVAINTALYIWLLEAEFYGYTDEEEAELMMQEFAESFCWHKPERQAQAA